MLQDVLIANRKSPGRSSAAPGSSPTLPGALKLIALGLLILTCGRSSAEIIVRNWRGPRGAVIVGRDYTRAPRPAQYGSRRRRLRSLPAVSRGKST
jgi:hypothetical protein